MKVYLDTVGCRLNQSEIETYSRQFRAAGHELVASPDIADLVVINTCSVTAAASSDSRKMIRHAARSGEAEVVVTGCWSTLEPQAAARLSGVTRVIPNEAKDQLVPDLLQISPEMFDLEPVARQPIPGARLRTRAFIKVQDGCDNRCTFCVTTLARGPGRSRPIPEILADIRAAIQDAQEFTDSSGASPVRDFAIDDSSAREIVLTGVHLGSWGMDFFPPANLKQLVEAILVETSVPRLRLSSLEPWDLDEDFFSLWQDPRLCRQLHLPLQSGCAETLRRMARKTTPESFASLVSAARQACPQLAITTDVIVGFPGESQAEFAASLEFIERMDFAGGHVFTYSPRPGTAAAKLPGQVPHPVRKERNAIVRAVLSTASRRYQAGFIGQTLPVLWESATYLGPQTWQLAGLTDNYLRVVAETPRHLWNRITPVHLTGLTTEGLSGQVEGVFTE
jgi:threonylcarbamoyladenosine tRNA methylthiotransferase MtaB